MTVIYDIGSITDWLTAVGTVGAVITALWLARKDSKSRAKVKFEFGYEVGRNGMKEVPTFIDISIVNVGKTNIHITECSIETKHLFKKRTDKIVFLNGENNIDKLLTSGEGYSKRFPAEDIIKTIEQVRKRFDRFYTYYKDAGGNTYRKRIKF